MLCYVINSVSFLRKIIMYLWKLCPSRNTSNVADLPACCIETTNWRCNQIALRVWWLVLKLLRESNTAKLSTRNFVDLHRLSMTSSVPLSKIFKTLIFVLVMGWKLPQLIAAAFSCSSILFNFYLNAIPAPPDGIKLVQYADDISVFATGTVLHNMASLINSYSEKLTDFLSERDLIVSPEKSTVTLFTPDTKEANLQPNVYVQGKKVDLCKNPVLLGITFDTMYTFSKHVANVVSKAKKKLNLLKCLAGATWGQDKSTLLLTYKSICRSVLEYGAPIWAPAISDTNWNKLQSIQSQALRLATGCLLMSGIDHLHQETKVLPLRIHSNMITKQFLAAFFQDRHPGHKFLGRNKTGRNLKKTLLSFEDEVQDHFRTEKYKTVVRNIHTKTVQSTISNYPVNRVLNCNPPVINKVENTLDRRTRVQLARLRSGFSRLLQSYMSRIDDKEVDECPLCKAPNHDVNHLFNCDKNPTHLSPLDLWNNPTEVAKFLKLPDGW